jgi:hypothetical protein
MSINPVTKAIKAGNQLIHQTIYNQAGSVEKALLEYIMNSIDAKATEIHIDINDNGIQYSILDNGDGFGDANYSREEKEKCIDEVFGYLGFDHGAEDENYRVYGKFGIGRAQLWAFSKNSWHTHDMTMDVDIKNNGLSYDIQQVDEFIDGCKITGEFYDKISLNDILLIKKELAKFAAFAPIDVYFNGKIINKRMNALKNHLNVKGVIVELKPSSALRVYNQGIFVKEIPNYLFGTGGTICSEIGYPFQLNAARNDVLQSNCKLWKSLKSALNIKLNTESKKVILTDGLRISLLNRVAIGDYGDKDEYLTKPLIKMITNKYISLRSILINKETITVTEDRGSQKAENLHNSNVAKVLLSDFTEALATDDAGLIEILTEIASTAKYKRFNIKPANMVKPYAELAKDICSDKSIIDQKLLTKRQKIFLESINIVSVQNGLCNLRDHRKILLGKSKTADAWTDGRSFIAINQKLLDDIDNSAGYILKICNIIVHEYNHDDDNSDLHSFDFYKSFHDQTIVRSNGLYFALTSFLKAYTSRLAKNDFVISRKLNRSLNFFNELVIDDVA